ncbi:hypothetical protein ACS0TY_014550 [Phlomoides rotata]
MKKMNKRAYGLIRSGGSSAKELLALDIRCRVFLITLTKATHKLFSQLPHNSIRSFKKLSSMFIHQFASVKK